MSSYAGKTPSGNAVFHIAEGARTVSELAIDNPKDYSIFHSANAYVVVKHSIAIGEAVTAERRSSTTDHTPREYTISNGEIYNYLAAGYDFFIICAGGVEGYIPGDPGGSGIDVHTFGSSRVLGFNAPVGLTLRGSNKIVYAPSEDYITNHTTEEIFDHDYPDIIDIIVIMPDSTHDSSVVNEVKISSTEVSANTNNLLNNTYLILSVSTISNLNPTDIYISSVAFSVNPTSKSTDPNTLFPFVKSYNVYNIALLNSIIAPSYSIDLSSSSINAGGYEIFSANHMLPYMVETNLLSSSTHGTHIFYYTDSHDSGLSNSIRHDETDLYENDGILIRNTNLFNDTSINNVQYFIQLEVELGTDVFSFAVFANFSSVGWLNVSVAQYIGDFYQIGGDGAPAKWNNKAYLDFIVKGTTVAFNVRYVDYDTGVFKCGAYSSYNDSTAVKQSDITGYTLHVTKFKLAN